MTIFKRHSPILIIFLSIFEKIKFKRLSNKNYTSSSLLVVTLFFYQILKLKFESIDKKILLLLVGLIFYLNF